MTSGARRSKVLVMVFVAAAAFGLGTRRAETQFGFGMGGMGYGWGWGGFSQVPKPESFLYQKALVDAGRNTNIPSRNVYANNSNSYLNRVRDNTFVERYDVAPPGAVALSIRRHGGVGRENNSNVADRASSDAGLAALEFL